MLSYKGGIKVLVVAPVNITLLAQFSYRPVSVSACHRFGNSKNNNTNDMPYVSCDDNADDCHKRINNNLHVIHHDCNYDDNINDIPYVNRHDDGGYDNNNDIARGLYMSADTNVRVSDHYNTGDNKLKIGFLNVHGLKSKLKFKDFDEYMDQYDIVCLCETFIEERDIENLLDDNETIPGFKLIHKIRKGKTDKISGGLCIAIKHAVSPLVTHVPNECNNLLWCKINANLLSIEDDVYLCCGYVSPEGSPYSNVDCFLDIESEMLYFSSKTNHIVILGDFNAHTNKQTNIHTYMHTYLHTYIRTYIRTFVHTYIRT